MFVDGWFHSDVFRFGQVYEDCLKCGQSDFCLIWRYCNAVCIGIALLGVTELSLCRFSIGQPFAQLHLFPLFNGICGQHNCQVWEYVTLKHFTVTRRCDAILWSCIIDLYNRPHALYMLQMVHCILYSTFSLILASMVCVCAIWDLERDTHLLYCMFIPSSTDLVALKER